MRFWDSSALVPLLVDEVVSEAVFEELARDPHIVAWWSTETECASAVVGLERHGVLGPGDATAAMRRLDALAGTWQEVQPVPVVRRTSIRLLRVHPIRAADALQLAAAVVVAEGNPTVVPFVTRDARLAEAASREGFPVITPGLSS